jgi:hypothetical protein
VSKLNKLSEEYLSPQKTQKAAVFLFERSWEGAVLRIRDVYPGSRILIFTHPGSRISDPGSRIPDPKTATKERGEKKLVVIP